MENLRPEDAPYNDDWIAAGHPKIAPLAPRQVGANSDRSHPGIHDAILKILARKKFRLPTHREHREHQENGEFHRGYYFE